MLLLKCKLLLINILTTTYIFHDFHLFLERNIKTVIIMGAKIQLKNKKTGTFGGIFLTPKFNNKNL